MRLAKTINTFRSYFAIVMLSLCQHQVAAAQSAPQEKVDTVKIKKIKAAYLYNFIKYIELPANPILNDAEVFTVCVLGKNTLGSALEELSGKLAKSKPVKIAIVSHPSQASLCHLVFVSRTEEHHIRSVIRSLNQRAILSVSDINEFASLGGIIGFKQEAQRIKIEINLKQAKLSGIKISALLLEVATIIN
ncbi:YfiR family protein [Aliikangiella sp. IMCC44632]